MASTGLLLAATTCKLPVVAHQQHPGAGDRQDVDDRCARWSRIFWVQRSVPGVCANSARTCASCWSRRPPAATFPAVGSSATGPWAVLRLWVGFVKTRPPT